MNGNCLAGVRVIEILRERVQGILLRGPAATTVYVALIIEDTVRRRRRLRYPPYKDDLPLNFHPAAFRALACCMPGWAG